MGLVNHLTCTRRRVLLFVCFICLSILVIIRKTNTNNDGAIRGGYFNYQTHQHTLNLESFSTREMAKNATFAMILTYARSGSSWLGDITNHGPMTFYVFEPFLGLIKEGYYRGGDIICFSNNTCRESRTLTETNLFVFKQLYYVFTCQLKKVHETVRAGIRSKADVPEYSRCVKIRGNNCVALLESYCLRTNHRIVKTIRISMELVNTMVNLFPQLHLIHLIRDPRAVTGSRLSNVKTFTMTTDTEAQTSDLCNRMAMDLYISRKIYQNLPGRQTLVVYEDLAEYTMSEANRIFEFLKMKMTPNTSSWLYKSTHSETDTGYFGTSRNDTISVAYKWRSTLDFKTVAIMDKLCTTVYKEIGYLPMKTQSELNNLKMPSRIVTNNVMGKY